MENNEVVTVTETVEFNKQALKKKTIRFFRKLISPVILLVGFILGHWLGLFLAIAILMAWRDA